MQDVAVTLLMSLSTGAKSLPLTRSSMQAHAGLCAVDAKLGSVEAISASGDGLSAAGDGLSAAGDGLNWRRTLRRMHAVVKCYSRSHQRAN